LAAVKRVSGFLCGWPRLVVARERRADSVGVLDSSLEPAS
jgi:hypothetical protein